LQLLIRPTNAGTNILEAAHVQNSEPSGGVAVALKNQPTPTESQEEKDLKIEIQLLKNFQASLLQTVYWSLGIVFAIALLLVGYNWISANKIFERDKGALKQDVLNSQKQLQADFETRNTSFVTSSLTSINESVQRLSREVTEKLNHGLSSVDDKYTSFTQDVSGKLTTGLTSVEEKYLSFRDETGKTIQDLRSDLDSQLRTFIKTSLGDLDSRLTGRIDAQTTALKQQFDEQQTKMLFLTKDLNDSIAEGQEENEMWSTAYTTYFKSFQSVVTIGWEYFISQELTNLIRTLEHGAQLFDDEKTTAAQIVSKLPDKHKGQANAYLELVRKAPLMPQPPAS
jgi:hypothetical protein